MGATYVVLFTETFFVLKKGKGGELDEEAIQETSVKGTTTTYTYDERNDRLEEVQTGNSTVRYGYEVDGAIKFITTPSGTVYQYIYDDFGRTTAGLRRKCDT